MAHKFHILTTKRGPVTVQWAKAKNYFWSDWSRLFKIKNFSTFGLIVISIALVALFSLTLKYFESSLNKVSWFIVDEVYAADANNNLRAEFLGTADIKFPITVMPAELVRARLSFKNIGSATWANTNKKELGIVLTSQNADAFNPTWISKNVVAKISNTVKPSESLDIPVSFYVPIASGAYTYTFTLKRNNLDVAGGVATLAIVVDQNPANRSVPSTTTMPVSVVPTANVLNLTPVSQNPFTITNASTAWVGAEPNIRIGLTYASPHVITADSAFFATAENGATLFTYGSGTLVTVTSEHFNNQIIYHLKTLGNEIMTTSPVRFSAQGGIIQIPSHTRAQNNAVVYNIFRGIIEIRYAPETGNTWAINELPLEQYLAGIRETSNLNPLEYLKTMTVAARSYGLYHLLRNKKYTLGKFHLTSTDSDQVYKGYLSELEMPNLTLAVSATRGQVVTYDGKVAVTPYFARGNGQTRTNPALPYVQAVVTPATAGYARLGHGYGVDATDAAARARQGAPYYEIVKYYFQGVNLERVY